MLFFPLFCEFVRLERICLAIAYFFENLVILSHILDDSRVLGTVHFILGRGGWWDLRRERHAQKYGFKGRGAGKKLWIKSGGHQKNSFKFCSDSICDKANNQPECQKPAFVIFRKFRFSREVCPQILCKIMHKRGLLPIKMQKKTYQMYSTIYRTYHCEKKNLYCYNKKMECLLPLSRVVGKQSYFKNFSYWTYRLACPWTPFFLKAVAKGLVFILSLVILGKNNKNKD